MQFDEFLCQGIDVRSASLFADTNSHDDHELFVEIGPVDNPVTLPNGAKASKSRELPNEGLALLIWLLGESAHLVSERLLDPPV